MKVTERIRSLAQPVVEEHGCTLWDVEYVREGGEWFLRLYIDKDGENITSEQLSWWYSADMMGSMNNEILCHGTEPQVDIPVIITYVKLETGD